MKLSVNIIIVVAIARDFKAVPSLVVIIVVPRFLLTVEASSFLFIIDVAPKVVEVVVKISAILIAVSEFLIFDIAEDFVEAQVNLFFRFFSIVHDFVSLVITNSGFLQACENVVGLLITDLPSALSTLHCRR
ncbi:hypothetical protein J3459_017326 [Metarhizium acridum]|nr:hypothetical protein J3459_017326 [Metarhizium acridum]